MYSGGFKDDFKNAFNKPNNEHTQLIIINVAVFLILAVLKVIGDLSGLESVFVLIYDQFSVPPLFSDFITRPWTIITYSFAHSLSGFIHIFFNMLVFYWFGRLVIEYLGGDKLISIYVLGAISGAALYLLAYNLIPFYTESAGRLYGMVGASAAVTAAVVAAATLMPNYTFFMLFIGPVKIKYIAAFFVVTSFLWSTGTNAGGNIAHLGGALIGYLFIRQLQKGTDIGAWVIRTMNFFKSFFVRQPNIKVSYKKTSTSKKQTKASGSTKSAASSTSQDEIDEILDKISEKGYESLSKEEKQKLFNASKK